MSIERLKAKADIRWWPPYAIIASWILAGAPLLYFVNVRDQAVNPPTCSGIGFGCTPDPSTTVGLYLIIIAGPALIVAAAILALLGLLGPRSRQFRLGLSLGVPPALILVAWILS